MSEPILPRAAIVQQAEAAALNAATLEAPKSNPFPVGSDAAAVWDATFERYLQQYSVPDGEASA